ncbi:MAG: hypothetical protein ACP5PT_02635 [Brevinematia bacterium]
MKLLRLVLIAAISIFISNFVFAQEAATNATNAGPAPSAQVQKETKKSVKKEAKKEVKKASKKSSKSSNSSK